MAEPEQLQRRHELMDRMMQKRGAWTPMRRFASMAASFQEVRAKCRYYLHEEHAAAG
jgi:hypothetical protein